MLFCSSFTQSERFLQTDQTIIRLQVVVATDFIRMLRNVFVIVFKPDAVIWWAAIFRREEVSRGVPGEEGRSSIPGRGEWGSCPRRGGRSSPWGEGGLRKGSPGPRTKKNGARRVEP